MTFAIVSKVAMYGMTMRHEHTQEFPDDSNVFGRALEYRQYMRKQFPNATSFELISAKEVRDAETV